MNQPFRKLLLLVTILFPLQTNFIFAQQPESWQSKVSPSLLSKLNEEEQASFIVLMNQKADLSEAKRIQGKEAKGEFVFGKLSELAKSSQQ